MSNQGSKGLIKKLREKAEQVRKGRDKTDDNFYGGDGTWHQTGHVDVQLNKKGEVVAVWFRCRMLPFRESREYTKESTPKQGEGSIKGIVFEEEGKV